MPFEYDAEITDVNDAIKSLVNSTVSTAVSALDTRANNLQSSINGLKTRVKALEDAQTPTPTPTPPPAISSGTPVWTQNGVTFNGKVANVPLGTDIYLRVDTSALNGQQGHYEYEPTTTADGSVNIVLADFTTPQAKLYWTLATGASVTGYGTVFARGEVSQPVAPTPPPPTGDFTGGSGGALTDQTNLSFTNSAGTTSRYHLYAAGLNWSKKVGILIYGDGSAEYGLKNPGQSYLLAGTNGLIATAKKHNMILLTPLAPGDGCKDGDGTCWYDDSFNGITPAQKLRWSFDLIQRVYSQYNIDKSRVAVGGYSSGAQWTSQFLIPAHGVSIMTDGVFVPIAYGGAPRVTTTFTQEFKNNVVGSWDCGTSDPAYTSASYGAIGGYNWYTSNGFATDRLWISGKNHNRSGEFGSIMDREITQHVKTA